MPIQNSIHYHNGDVKHTYSIVEGKEIILYYFSSNKNPTYATLTPVTMSGRQRKQKNDASRNTEKETSDEPKENPGATPVEECEDIVFLGENAKGKCRKNLLITQTWEEGYVPIIDENTKELVGCVIPLLADEQPRQFINDPPIYEQLMNIARVRGID